MSNTAVCVYIVIVRTGCSYIHAAVHYTICTMRNKYTLFYYTLGMFFVICTCNINLLYFTLIQYNFNIHSVSTKTILAAAQYCIINCKINNFFHYLWELLIPNYYTTKNKYKTKKK